MSLLTRLSGKYQAKVQCSNCSYFGLVLIPKGVTIKEFLRSEMGVCENCGCSTLEINNNLKIDNAKEVLEKAVGVPEIKPEMSKAFVDAIQKTQRLPIGKTVEPIAQNNEPKTWMERRRLFKKRDKILPKKEEEIDLEPEIDYGLPDIEERY